MEEQEFIEQVKKKKAFSKFPESIIRKALELQEFDLVKTRAFLRKYFGVFLTNKIVRGKGTAEELLGAHLSSKKRDYGKLYTKLFSHKRKWKTVVDFGAGVNGLSFSLLQERGINYYLGFEAAGQVVDLVNEYFVEEQLEGVADMVHLDLFEVEEVERMIESSMIPRIAFLFQLVDALESLEKDFSKKFLLCIAPYFDRIVISLPLASLGGKKKFTVDRKWLVNFLQEHFVIEQDFEMSGERFLVVCHKT